MPFIAGRRRGGELFTWDLSSWQHAGAEWSSVCSVARGVWEASCHTPTSCRTSQHYMSAKLALMVQDVRRPTFGDPCSTIYAAHVRPNLEPLLSSTSGDPKPGYLADSEVRTAATSSVRWRRICDWGALSGHLLRTGQPAASVCLPFIFVLSIYRDRAGSDFLTASAICQFATPCKSLNTVTPQDSAEIL